MNKVEKLHDTVNSEVHIDSVVLIKTEVNNLTAGQFINAHSAELLKKIGKAAIPYLIDVIDRPQMGFIGFVDPTESTIHPARLNNYTGIRAAHLIEYILSDTSHPRIYHYSVIVQAKSGDWLESLNIDDMKAIKRIYLNWWNNNQTKSLSQLTRERKKGSIIDGSNYEWR